MATETEMETRCLKARIARMRTTLDQCADELDRIVRQSDEEGGYIEVSPGDLSKIAALMRLRKE